VGERVDEVEDRGQQEEHHQHDQRRDEEPQRVVVAGAAGHAVGGGRRPCGARGRSECSRHGCLPGSVAEVTVGGAGRRMPAPPSADQKPEAPIALASWANWSWVAWATSTGVLVPWIISPRFRYRSGFAIASACIEPTESASESLTSSSACGTSDGVSTESCSDGVDWLATKSA